MASDLRGQLVAIFADVFQHGIDPGVVDIARAAVPAWDSISHFRLVLELERVFELSLSEDEVTGLESLGDVESLLERRGVGGTDRGAS